VNNVLAVLLALIIGIASADMPATPTDLDYIFGPLEIVDALDEDEAEEEPYVYIEIDNPYKPIYIGDEVTLRCVMVGLVPEECDIRWEYCTDIDAEDYVDLDWHEVEYTFVTSYENVGYYYRVVVTHPKLFKNKHIGKVLLYPK